MHDFALMQDQVALRAFERICKGQGTEAAVKKLRDETPELWRETVMRFRDTKQASSTGRVKFDTAKHLTVVRHSLAQEEEMECRPMTCGEYIKHHMEKPPPFTLSETSALAAWYQDLKDEGVKKSERRMYNPKSKKEEIFTRVHVHTGEVQPGSVHSSRHDVQAFCGSARAHPVQGWRRGS